MPKKANMVPSGKLTELWKITIFNGKTHYKWAIFNSYVKLPEGNPTVILPKITRNGWDSNHFQMLGLWPLGESHMIFVVSLVFTKRQGCTWVYMGVPLNPTESK